MIHKYPRLKQGQEMLQRTFELEDDQELVCLCTVVEEREERSGPEHWGWGWKAARAEL